MNAIKIGWKAFSDPESESRALSQSDRANLYGTGWAYYTNKMFSRRMGENWTVYLAARELYKHTRLVFNPVPQIVDFYVDNVWQHPRNAEYEALVTPLSDSTDQEIIEAVAQLDQWGNFLAEQQKIKRYAASTGNVLIEGIDDWQREKILHRVVWAGYLTEPPVLNDTGDVQSYTIEYDVWDADAKKTYRFRKIADKETFRYFRDDKPFVPPGKTESVEANPYGFCFAVWLRHTDDGGDYGNPACRSFDKVDEVNSLASHLFDNIHKEIESGKILGLEDPRGIEVLTGAHKNRDGSINQVDPRLERVLLAAKGNVSVHDLSGLLKLAEAYPYLKDLIASFDDDYPELQAAAIIQKNSQLSGAALERMLTPAQNRLDAASANYNQQLIKLRQMQLAVAGFRTSGGGWTTRNAQQQLFRAFDLNSYERGLLDFQLKRSVLVQMDEAETEDVLMKKAQRSNELKETVDVLERLMIAGYSEDESVEIMRRRAAEQPSQIEPQPNPILTGIREPMRLGAGDGVN